MSLAVIALAFFTSCSTTSSLPEDEILYIGIKDIKVEGAKDTYAENIALDEVKAALAYAPNGSFMGSSSVRTPFPIGLWLHNALVNKQNNFFTRWLFNSFATNPVTISRVSPLTRSRVATNLLQNYGYMNGEVTYSLIDQKNPKKQKISYNITLGEPFIYDSIRYDFPALKDSIVRANIGETLLKKEGQFSTFDLTSEKSRLVSAFHDNGFYYYRPDYINYLADTVNHRKHVTLLVQEDKDTPDLAQRQFHIGNVSAYIRSNNSQQTTRRVASTDSVANTSTKGSSTSHGYGFQYDDSLVMRGLKVVYQGKRLPISSKVLFRNFRFWRRQMYNQTKVGQTLTNLHNMNIFSNVRMTFTPRDTTATCDTLDVRLDATMDKLIDAELEFNITQKSNSQIGPHLGITFSKRNAFHHGEKLSLKLKGSYEWQTEHKTSETESEKRRINSYEAGLEASITYPWIVFPRFRKIQTPGSRTSGTSRRRRRLFPSSTKFAISINHLSRSYYFRTVTGELEARYSYQTGDSWTHEFTPLSLAYRKVLKQSDELIELMKKNAYIKASMQNQFIPSMRYTITYNNSWNENLRNTTNLELTVKESSNLLNGVNALLGFDYFKKDKKLLGTPYSQFLKSQITLKNHFKLTPRSEIATRVQLGMIWSYGNSTAAPLSELFYVGGANSIRAFAVRSIGPGSYKEDSGIGSYVYQTGDFKLELNAEYRFPIISSLYGAFFIDAGNVWIMKTNKDTFQKGAQLTAKDFFKDLAVGTGFGLRYDLHFLVLRLDCGIAIHAPYNTGKSSYYNIRKFSEGFGVHFAVGYPF